MNPPANRDVAEPGRLPGAARRGRRKYPRLRLWLARYRLRGHMFDRLVMGGSPDCPCSDCERLRALVRDLTGEEWNDPERARYYRDVFEIGDPWGGDYRVPVLDPEYRRRTREP